MVYTYICMYVCNVYPFSEEERSYGVCCCLSPASTLVVPSSSTSPLHSFCIGICICIISLQTLLWSFSCCFRYNEDLFPSTIVAWWEGWTDYSTPRILYHQVSVSLLKKSIPLRFFFSVFWKWRPQLLHLLSITNANIKMNYKQLFWIPLTYMCLKILITNMQCTFVIMLEWAVLMAMRIANDLEWHSC